MDLILGIPIVIFLLLAPVAAWVSFFTARRAARTGDTATKELHRAFTIIGAIRSDIEELKSGLQKNAQIQKTSAQVVGDPEASQIDQVGASSLKRLTADLDAIGGRVQMLESALAHHLEINREIADEEPVERVQASGSAGTKLPGAQPEETIVRSLEVGASERTGTPRPVPVRQEYLELSGPRPPLEITGPAGAPLEIRYSPAAEADRATLSPPSEDAAARRAVEIPEPEAAVPAKADLEPAIPATPDAARRSRLAGALVRATRKFLPRDRDDGDWETRVGRHWLNVIGIVVLVVGLVLLIQQTLLLMGPIGKIGLGAATGLLLIAWGLYLEPRRNYHLFARTLVGGGWALLYFTAYAAYNIEAARIIHDGRLALAVLLATAGGIIIQSFAYRAQFVTGLAYALGFLAIHLSPISLYSLIAVAVLAGSVVLVIRITDWRVIGVVSVMATYGTHARWLWATEAARNLGSADIILSGLSPATAFWANLGLLVVSWSIFCAAVLVRRAETDTSEEVDIGITVLNLVGLLGLAAWQIRANLPGHLHHLAAVAALGYAAVSVADRRMNRPSLAQFNGTAAVVLYAVALPLALKPEKISADWLAPYWAVGAFFVWQIGRRLPSSLYRGQAYVLSGLAAAAALLSNFQGRMLEHEFLPWSAGLLTLLVVEFIGERLSPERQDDKLEQGEHYIGAITAPVSAAIIAAAIWSVREPYEVGFLLFVAACLLLETGARVPRLGVRVQAYLLLAAGSAALLAINIANPPVGLEGRSWIYTLAAAALGYAATGRMTYGHWALRDSERNWKHLLSAAATALFAGATYHAFAHQVVAVVWVFWALLLVETGGRLRETLLRLEGYALALMAAAAAATFDLDGGKGAIHLGWLWALIVAAALYVVSWRMRFSAWGNKSPAEQNYAGASALPATLLVAAAAFDALPREAFALAWAVWALVLVEVGGRVQEGSVRWQGYVLAISAAGGAALFDLTHATETYMPGWLWALSVSAMLYAVGARMRFAAWSDKHLTEQQLSTLPNVLGTLLFAWATWQALDSEVLPIIWTAWALALLEAGGRLREQPVRLQAYLLGLAAFVLALEFDLLLSPAAGARPGWVYAFVCAGLLYTATLRMLLSSWAGHLSEKAIASVPSWLATILAAGTLYRALPLDAVGLAWLGWALILQEAGRRLKNGEVSGHGLLLAIASWIIAIAVNVYQLVTPPDVSVVPNWSLLGAQTAGFYALHWRSRVGVNTRDVEAWLDRAPLLHAATLFLVLSVWRELPSIAVALAWTAIALAAVELSEKIERKALVLQAQLLIIAAVARLLMANFINPGEFLGISHRLVTAVPVIATLYYLRAFSLSGWGQSPRIITPSVYSWAAALLVIILARFEVGREYAVAVWSPVILVLLWLGSRLPDRDFRFQSYAIAVLVFGRSWATNLYLEGSLFGISERIVTVIPALTALLIAIIMVPLAGQDRSQTSKTRLHRAFDFADRHSRAGLSILFSFLISLSLFYELPINVVSIGWAVEALVLVVLGFALKERSFRLFGLIMLLLCILKVVLLDLQGVETLWRVFSFIVLGIVLLMVSFGYTRHRHTFERYF